MVGVPYFLNRLKGNFDIWLLSVLQWLYHTETASKYYLTNKFLTIVKKLQSYIENNLSAISFGTVESWSVGFVGKSVTISEDQEWKHCWALLSLTFTSEKLKNVEGVSLRISHMYIMHFDGMYPPCPPFQRLSYPHHYSPSQLHVHYLTTHRIHLVLLVLGASTMEDGHGQGHFIIWGLSKL